MKNLLLFFIMFSFFFSPAYAQGGKAYMSQVERVIDGDTLLLINGVTIELIGIDCPEMDTEEGKEAKEFVKGLVEGKEVRLEFDVGQKDKYGRLLAYVHVKSQLIDWVKTSDEEWVHDTTEYEYFLNKRIIEQGYASPMTIPPNVKYADLFQKLYQEARENKRGLWAAKELSKKEIIQIATMKARELGYVPEDMDILYDEGNRALKKHFVRGGVSVYNKETKEWAPEQATTPEEELPELKNRNYQSVYFGPKGLVLGGDLWVFIDKNTGEIITFMEGE